ncbi:MAG: hypothetical protein BV456_00615 [Thermoplasmata archaeon M8B2D]|nr:MAG: hypothetical protein BV456_00615 [Thermoplasmata archaeon M8B2D]
METRRIMIEIKEIIMIECLDEKGWDEILVWLEENTEFEWLSGDKPTSQLSREIGYTITKLTSEHKLVLNLTCDNTLTYGEPLESIDTLNINEFKEKYFVKKKDYEHRGMVYNPISGKWNWGF